MIPSVWQAVIITLACLRTTRLIGWDDLPALVAARRWVTGEHTMNSGSTNARLGQTAEPVTHRTAWRRPALAYGLSCAYCLSVWGGVAWYAAWRLWPSWTLAAAFPLAVSSAVGLIARWLDP